MTGLHFERVGAGADGTGDGIGDADGRAGHGPARDWRHVHNVIVPPFSLSLADVLRRARRNHLEVVYADGVLAGCSTVRPPRGGEAAATVIARVLPAHRGRGIGGVLYERAVARAREEGAAALETLVLETNPAGLRFALRHGFTEVERYVLPGLTVPEIALRRPLDRRTTSQWAP